MRDAWRNDGVFARGGNAGAGPVRRVPDPRRPQGADGPPALRKGRHRGGPARRQPARRQRAGDRQGAHRHAQQGRRQEAGRGRAGRRPQRHRLQVRPHPDAAPRRQDLGGGGADGHHPAARRKPRPRRVVDRAPPAGAQAARRGRSKEGVYRRPRRHAADARQLPRRPAMDRRLGRAALPQRSGDRRGPLQEGHRRRREPDLDGARAVLAGPRGGGAEADPGGPRPLPGGGALSRPPITARSPAPRPGSARSRSMRPPR